MAAVNDVTGDAIKSKGTTDKFRNNFDKIFGTKKCDKCDGDCEKGKCKKEK